MSIKQVSIKYILFFLLLFSVELLSAQIVNIEDKRAFITDTTGWFGSVDLGFNLVKNSKLVTTTKGSIRVDYVGQRYSLFSLTNYSFVKAGEEQFVNQGFQHFRYNYAFNPQLIGEVFAQAQYNERIRIQLRTLGGAGVRYKVLENNVGKAFLGTAYMYEYEEIADTSIIHRNHRMSSYLSFNINPNSKINLSNTSYFQPVLRDFSDFRFTTATSLQLHITERLSIKSNFTLTYDSQLSEEISGIPPSIYSFLNGFSWRF